MQFLTLILYLNALIKNESSQQKPNLGKTKYMLRTIRKGFHENWIVTQRFSLRFQWFLISKSYHKSGLFRVYSNPYQFEMRHRPID